MNGGSSAYVTPSIVTWRSCMHSSSAAWVFGEARLTSSTRSRLANTGPGRNSNSFVLWLKTLTPVTSDGSRSGVNWRRENEQSSERASALASIVLPTPGKSSMIRCPSARRQSTTRRSRSVGAWTTRARLATIAPTRSAGAGVAAGSAKEALDLVQDRGGDLLLRRPGDRALPARREERDLVVGGVEPDAGAADVVEDDEVGVLAGALLACPLEPGLALVGGEADEHAAVAGTFAEGGEHVGRRLQLDRPDGAVLGALGGERLGGPVVGDGGGHDHDVGVLAAGEGLGLELGGGGRLDELHARRRGHGEVRAEQRDAGPAPAGFGG